jgi:hypothetical protein
LVLFNIAHKVFVLNNFVGSVNLFPWVHYEGIQRGSLAAVRYAARAARFLEGSVIASNFVLFK